MMKKFNEFINEGYQITQDDYNYFKGIVDEILNDPNDLNREGNRKFWIDSLKNDRQKHISIMIAFAKHDWANGGGDPTEFPRKELTKVANDVLDEIINDDIK